MRRLPIDRVDASDTDRYRQVDENFHAVEAAANGLEHLLDPVHVDTRASQVQLDLPEEARHVRVSYMIYVHTINMANRAPHVPLLARINGYSSTGYLALTHGESARRSITGMDVGRLGYASTADQRYAWGSFEIHATPGRRMWCAAEYGYGTFLSQEGGLGIYSPAGSSLVYNTGPSSALVTGPISSITMTSTPARFQFDVGSQFQVRIQ